MIVPTDIINENAESANKKVLVNIFQKEIFPLFDIKSFFWNKRNFLLYNTTGGTTMENGSIDLFNVVPAILNPECC